MGGGLAADSSNGCVLGTAGTRRSRSCSHFSAMLSFLNHASVGGAKERLRSTGCKGSCARSQPVFLFAAGRLAPRKSRSISALPVLCLLCGRPSPRIGRS